MSRILCSLSGIEFKVEHHQIYLHSREYHHPIFSASLYDLLSLSTRYYNNQFSETEEYLYYLALFKSTDLVDFRVPAQFTQTTQSIVASNLFNLHAIIEKMSHLGMDRCANTLQFARFVISPDTKSLSCTKDWIDIWNANYTDYQSGYKTSTRISQLSKLEHSLERYIKDRSKDISTYSSILASWAAKASGFEYDTQIVADGTDNDRPIPLNQYWKKLIIFCAKNEDIFRIHDGDLSELIDYCEDSLDLVSNGIFSHTLMAILRSCQKKKKDFLDLGDIDIGSRGVTYRTLDADASIEDANKLALIESAPISQPKLSEYPNKLAYLKAKMKYDLASEYRKSQEILSQNSTSSTAPSNSTAESTTYGRRKEDFTIDKL